MGELSINFVESLLASGVTIITVHEWPRSRLAVETRVCAGAGWHQLPVHHERAYGNALPHFATSHPRLKPPQQTRPNTAKSTGARERIEGIYSLRKRYMDKDGKGTHPGDMAGGYGADA